MAWTDKPWGKTRREHQSPICQVDQIEVLAGGYCSIHCHAAKANAFHVLSGAMFVRQFTDRGMTFRSKHLSAGESLIVPAGIWHQFWSPLKSNAVEVYLPINGSPVDPEDIERLAGLAVGGIELTYGGMERLWSQAFKGAELCKA